MGSRAARFRSGLVQDVPLAGEDLRLVGFEDTDLGGPAQPVGAREEVPLPRYRVV